VEHQITLVLDEVSFVLFTAKVRVMCNLKGHKSSRCVDLAYSKGLLDLGALQYIVSVVGVIQLSGA